MEKGELLYYNNIEVEIIEVDYEFDLVLVRIVQNKRKNYVSSKLLSYIPVKDNFISIRLLRGDQKWY